VDELLLLRSADETQPPVLRLYTWDPPTLSLGYAQRLDMHVNMEKCRQRQFGVVRRITGGKAVLHHHELTYSLTGSVHRFPFNQDLLGTYHTIAQGFLKFFDLLGIDASLAAPDPLKNAGMSSCFACPSAYEILVNGKKILGSAQKRTNTAILQHGSLLLEYHWEDWCAVLRRNRNPETEVVTSLGQELGKVPPMDGLIETMKSGFEKSLGIVFTDMLLSSDKLKKVEQVADVNYPDLIS